MGFDKDKTQPPKRILICKIGLDGHDRGALVVSRFLRDQGYEVVYSGLHKSPSQIAEIALQEDVNAIGVSILSGSHVPLLNKLVQELQKRELTDLLLFVGGIIPKSDFHELGQIGIQGIFPSGTELSQIETWLRRTIN